MERRDLGDTEGRKGFLKVIAGPSRGLVVELVDRPMTIGRSEQNDIALDDPSVSSVHARIVAGPARVTLEDLGSRNGTFVNAMRADSVDLKFGDRLRIGVSEIAYEESLERFALGKAADPDSSVRLDEDSGIVWKEGVEDLDRTLEIDELGDGGGLVAKNLEVVFEVIRQSNAVLTTPELLERILDILVRTFKADRGFVILLEPEADGRFRQELAAVHNRAGGAIAVASTIIDRVVESRSPVLSFDAMRDARFSHADSVVQQNVKAVLCAPILKGDDLIGLVHLDSDNSSGLFGREDLELLKVLTDEVALSIENSKLYQQLRRLVDHSSAILECLGEGLLAVDVDGRLTTVNGEAERMLALEAAASIGRPAADLAALAPAWALLSETLETGRRIEDGEIEAGGRPLSVSTSVLRDRTDAVRGAIATIRDLTAERDLEHRVNRSERLAAMGEAVAGVAHELRNPLTVMRGLTQLIQKRLVEDDKGSEYASMVIEGIDRVSKIIRELLEFARDTRLVLARVDPAALVADIAREYEPVLAGRGRRLEVAIDEGLPEIVLDADKIRQVVVNLITNGAEAVEDGGTVDVLVGSEGEDVVISVTDDGVGMAEEVQARIFEPFFTSKDEGTGLGLYISRKLIEQQGGRIDVHSVEGQGSTFRIRLPFEKRRR